MKRTPGGVNPHKARRGGAASKPARTPRTTAAGPCKPADHRATDDPLAGSLGHGATLPGEPRDTQAAPDDRDLVQSLRSGDPSALPALMARYDRLVRYTVYRAAPDRCAADPHWLDTVSADAWMGLAASLQRLGAAPPGSLPHYLVRIARNRAVSALRTHSRRAATGGGALPLEDALEEKDAGPTPDELVSRLDEVARLRVCMEKLKTEDKEICVHIELIAERRWSEVAMELGQPESTLRSRWKVISDNLQRCMDRQRGDRFAPGGPAGD